MPDARIPLGGSPPGRSSQRTDLGPAGAFQPVRIPTGQPYGQAKQVEQLQQARPLQRAQPRTATPTRPPLPQNGRRGAFAGGGADPLQVLATIGATPSNRPAEPITAGNRFQGAGQSPLGAGFKLDVLRHIASLPFAGPQIQQLVAKAYNELNYGNNVSNAGPAGAVFSRAPHPQIARAAASMMAQQAPTPQPGPPPSIPTPAVSGPAEPGPAEPGPAAIPEPAAPPPPAGGAGG